MKHVAERSWLTVAAVLVLAAAYLAVLSIRDAKSSVARIDAAPGAGFHWPYYLYVPPGLRRSASADRPLHLLVMSNNTGGTDDDPAVHDLAARRQIEGRARRLADALVVPALVPVFPRPQSNWRLYTHALDRDTLATDIADLQRLDLQLLAMIDDAIGRLSRRYGKVERRVLITGFSADGMFANRFTLLHPDRVKAAAIGSPGGWPIAPVGAWKGRRLRYPIGVADVDELVGEGIDLAAFRAVPHFFFLGENDDNDSVPFDDGYDDEDEVLIFELFGSTPPARWAAAEELYASVGADARFRLYEGVGHAITPGMRLDVRTFFEDVLRQNGGEDRRPSGERPSSGAAGADRPEKRGIPPDDGE